MPPTTYRITVEGRITQHLGSAFEGFALEPGREQTVLVGQIRDQAHLYGVLDRVRSLGLQLVSVQDHPTAVRDRDDVEIAEANQWPSAGTEGQ
jgi:hypothetical protein